MRDQIGAEIADPAAREEECSVCVAVMIRPLVQAELDVGCATSLSATPKLPTVSVYSRTSHLHGVGMPSHALAWPTLPCPSLP